MSSGPTPPNDPTPLTDPTLLTDPRPPAEIRFRPHHPVLRRGPDAVQLGLLPGRAVEAAELSPPLMSLLLELHGTWRLDDVLARALTLGADPATTLTLLDELTATGGLLDATEIHRAERSRQEAVVQLHGAGPLVAEVAGELAAAGVGTVWVDAPAEPEPGVRRAEAVAAPVQHRAWATRVHAGRPRRRPDLAIFTDALHPDPARCRELLAQGVPHLAARMADGLGLVGPLVLPGRSACLHCLSRHRADRDPRWPLVATQLTDRTGSGGPATVRATAALAAEQALLVVGPVGWTPPATLDAVLELDLALGSLHRRRWPPHPGCECGAAHRAAAGDTAHRPTTAHLARPGASRLGGAAGDERDQGEQWRIER